MTPLAVFVRTLLKTSALFIGVTVVMLHPSLEWSRASGLSPSSTWVRAGQSPAEGAVDALVGALKDSDAGVRRQAAAALGEIGKTPLHRLQMILRLPPLVQREAKAIDLGLEIRRLFQRRP